MPARVIQNSHGGNNNPKREGARIIKAPAIKESRAIQEEMQRAAKLNVTEMPNFSTADRAQFYAGNDRLELQGTQVQRVRQLQEENDHLQREIAEKEKELAECTDPLAILADIEHRKIIIARNTGEILKIYLNNEERIKRVKELEEVNQRIQNEMMEMQGRFISTKDLDEKTQFASEFFVLRSEIERNLQEISKLNEK